MILPLHDAKSVASLTGTKVPCNYISKDNAVAVVRQYLLKCVAPTGNELYGDDMVLVLDRALLWVSFYTTDSIASIMPAWLRSHIKNGLQGVDKKSNPLENNIYW
jgi:hypothetical protein